MALAQRLLNFTFTKSQGTFTEGGGNSVTLKGLRATAKITKAGTPSQGEGQLAIFGMTKSMMQDLSTLGLVFKQVPPNTVTVSAGDAGGAMTVVFVGTIFQAWADFKSAPEVPFNVLAHTIGSQSVTPMAPTSLKGSADVPSFMKTIAGQIGCDFENNGVSAKLSNPYFYGSPRSQADACAKAANINWVVDDNTLAIWPVGGSRGGDVPLISPSNTMEGYPAFTAYGISLRVVFNPAIKFGSKIKVQSSILPNIGEWAVVGLSHDLATLMPKGDWHTSIEAFNPKFPLPVR